MNAEERLAEFTHLSTEMRQLEAELARTQQQQAEFEQQIAVCCSSLKSVFAAQWPPIRIWHKELTTK